MKSARMSGESSLLIRAYGCGKETDMSRVLAVATSVARPMEIGSFFDDSLLVGSERPGEYEAIFESVAKAIKPWDAILWLCVQRLTDHAWYISGFRAHVQIP